MGYYQTQQVCLAGHQITSGIESSGELAAPFCSKCGEPTIHECPNCQAGIRGYYRVEGVISLRETPVPDHCHACGKPYPWRATALAAAMEAADELDELTEEDRKKLKGALADIATDNPRTDLAVTRIKKIALTLGNFSKTALQKIVLDIASAKARGMLDGLIS